MTATLEKRLSVLEAAILPRAEVVTPDACALLESVGLTPDPWQVQVAQSEANRILLNCCRQSGKTQVAAAVALATAMTEPGALVLVLSPSLRQSQESFRHILTLYRPWAGSLPPSAESGLRLELTNGSRIVSLPGQEETVRGYSGVDLLVIDEAARVDDSLYYAVRPMVAVSQGRVLCLSTPFGMRGFFYETWERGEGWERYEVPATQCPRIRAQFLAEERAAMPLAWYQAEYECQFSEVAYNVFTEESIQLMFASDAEPWDLKGF